jgi:hypothetical protein
VNLQGVAAHRLARRSSAADRKRKFFDEAVEIEQTSAQ